MIDLKFKFWCPNERAFMPPQDYSMNSTGDVYNDWVGCEDELIIPVQSTTFTAPCGREIWFGDIYYNAGYGNLHIKTMGDIYLLMEGLAENDIGAYLGNEYENPELLS